MDPSGADTFVLIFRLCVLASAIWVGFDSARLGAKRGVLGGGFVDIGPVAWFFCVLLLWIISLPVYLATRPKYVALQQQRHYGAPGPMGGFGQQPFSPYPGNPGLGSSQGQPAGYATAQQPIPSFGQTSAPAPDGSFAPPSSAPLQDDPPRFSKAAQQPPTGG